MITMVKEIGNIRETVWQTKPAAASSIWFVNCLTKTVDKPITMTDHSSTRQHKPLLPTSILLLAPHQLHTATARHPQQRLYTTVCCADGCCCSCCCSCLSAGVTVVSS